jgi:hypothetical protein
MKTERSLDYLRKLKLRSRMVELYHHSPYVFMAWCLINYAHRQIYHIYFKQRGYSPFTKARCDLRLWKVDMEGSCEYIEYEVAESRQGVRLQFGG